MRADQFWARLVDALQLLAADYETQREAIPNFAHLPDELALIYSESLLCIEQHTDELVDSIPIGACTSETQGIRRHFSTYEWKAQSLDDRCSHTQFRMAAGKRASKGDFAAAWGTLKST
jgi:hypothetical protein